MKVCGISSWPPRACGIATYFTEQSDAIRRLGHSFEMVCHTDSAGGGARAQVHPIIDVRDPQWPAKTAAYIAERTGCDVVHLQHEFGLYQASVHENGERIVELVRGLRERGLPVVATYHTLIGRMRDEHKEHYAELIPLTSVSVAHAQYQVEGLKDNIGYVPDNVRYVEHGAQELPPERVAELRRLGREQLGFDDRPVVMLNGFFADNKGHEYLVARWDDIYPQLTDQRTLLAAVGGIRVPQQQAYYDDLAAMVARARSPQNVRLISKVFTPDQFLASLAAADLLVAPYKDASQSGVLAHAASVHTPCLARDLEGLGAFCRDANQELIPFTGDVEADMEVMAERVVAVMNDLARRERMRRDLAVYVHNVISWERVAERYDAIYREALARPQGAGPKT
ncbi:MAG TPA: glycosyltransferase [Armatimonadota bacterium]|nr:glycosyltransferase [Armatimonadota bacterium]